MIEWFTGEMIGLVASRKRERDGESVVAWFVLVPLPPAVLTHFSLSPLFFSLFFLFAGGKLA
jgi:hypothetical protein